MDAGDVPARGTRVACGGGLLAIGIVMALHHVTDVAAFDLLRTASQRLHCTICDPAEDVIDVGACPTGASPRGPTTGPARMVRGVTPAEPSRVAP